MTVDEAILKAIALLQQQPEPRGPHISAALSLLADTQTTPTASSRLVAEATLPLQQENIALAVQVDKEAKRADAAEARVKELEGAIAAMEIPDA